MGNRISFNLIFNKYIKSNFSFFVLLGGTFSLFLSNYLLKIFLNEYDYGQYSLLVTYLSVITSFGLLGFEQVYLRLSHLEERKVKIDRVSIFFLLSLFLISVFGFSGIFTSFFYGFKDYSDWFYVFVITIICVFILFIYNSFRLLSQFVYSQIVNNFFKIFLLVSILVLFLLDKQMSFEEIKTVTLYSLIFTLPFIIYFFIKNEVEIVNDNLKITEVISLYIGFFIAILFTTFLLYGDRILIEKFLGKVELGNYFFLCNVFLFPYTLFQNYIGFKELVYLKNNSISIKELNVNICKILFKGAIFGIFLLLISWGLTFFISLPIDLLRNIFVIILLMFIGIVRLGYSYLSSVFGALGTSKSIQKANAYSLLTLIISFIFFFSFFNKITIFLMVLLFMFIWLSRSIIWFYIIKTNLLRHENNKV